MVCEIYHYYLLELALIVALVRNPDIFWIEQATVQITDVVGWIQDFEKKHADRQRFISF